MEHPALDYHVPILSGTELSRITKNRDRATVLRLPNDGGLRVVCPQHPSTDVLFKFCSHKFPFSIAHHALALAVTIVTQLLTMSQLYQLFPAAQLAIRPGRRRRERRLVCILL